MKIDFERALLKVARVLMLSFMCVLFLYGIGIVLFLAAAGIGSAIEMGVFR